MSQLQKPSIGRFSMPHNRGIKFKVRIPDHCLEGSAKLFIRKLDDELYDSIRPTLMDIGIGLNEQIADLGTFHPYGLLKYDKRVMRRGIGSQVLDRVIKTTRDLDLRLLYVYTTTEEIRHLLRKYEFQNKEIEFYKVLI